MFASATLIQLEPEEATAEDEELRLAEEMLDAEPRLETETSAVDEAVAIIVMDVIVAVEALLLPAPVADAGAELMAAPAFSGVSITTGFMATNTKFTF